MSKQVKLSKQLIEEVRSHEEWIKKYKLLRLKENLEKKKFWYNVILFLFCSIVFFIAVIIMTLTFFLRA